MNPPILAIGTGIEPVSEERQSSILAVELTHRMAEAVGFEPTRPFGPPSFQDWSLQPLEYASA